MKQLIKDGKIISPKPGTDAFFLRKSRNALTISKRLYDLFEEEQLDTYTWVINTSYYSMFFAATALLAKYNHKIDADAGIHKLTYHTLVYYFIKEESKFKWHLIEEYKEAIKDAEELLQLSEKKLKELVTDFGFELEKRKTFTYDLGKDAERNKALTSYIRAKNFFQEIEKAMAR
ncbi:hypothetical protein A3K73_08075 [Candidatus Pacearchaeota archaeon RBG_13_36_9]|nr:MAG: hypothetical protein A3K73_08075 [Candidatus Pacearchaeota archaeon RBG_13_36_9]